jgi:hypothetical protein
MIHIRKSVSYIVDNGKGNRRYVDKKIGFRDDLLASLGFDQSRIISGTVLADRVCVPRATSYSFTLGNPTEIKLLAKTLSSVAKIQLKQHTKSKEKNPLVSSR